MVLFPITENDDSTAGPVSAWAAVQERQTRDASSYWIITQPGHAALAGDLAGALRDEVFGPIDATVARSIALHDAGWSLDDAEQIQNLRAGKQRKPASFLDAGADRFLAAWTASIDVAENFASIGGYLVSRHFERLSKRDDAKDQSKLEAFRLREKQRQQRIKAKLDRDDATLEKLVDALQFCDLLSLYLCCGSKKSVVFSNPKVRLERDGEAYRIAPNPFKDAQQFTFSALKHPLSGAKKRESGASFYISFA
jgi:hypothetical protein